MRIDNMRFEFNIIVEGSLTPEEMIDKPIVINELPVGVIIGAKLDESGLLINCTGVIWSEYLHTEMIVDSGLSFRVASLVIGK